MVLGFAVDTSALNSNAMASISSRTAPRRINSSHMSQQSPGEGQRRGAERRTEKTLSCGITDTNPAGPDSGTVQAAPMSRWHVTHQGLYPTVKIATT